MKNPRRSTSNPLPVTFVEFGIIKEHHIQRNSNKMRQEKQPKKGEEYPTLYLRFEQVKTIHEALKNLLNLLN